MTKPIKMWAIKAPWRREIATRFSVERTRQKTIAAFEKSFVGTSWTCHTCIDADTAASASR